MEMVGIGGWWWSCLQLTIFVRYPVHIWAAFRFIVCAAAAAVIAATTDGIGRMYRCDAFVDIMP